MRMDVEKGQHLEVTELIFGARLQIVDADNMFILELWDYPSERMAQAAAAEWKMRNYEGEPIDGWTRTRKHTDDVFRRRIDGDPNQEFFAA